jgi:hypothetical protein
MRWIFSIVLVVLWGFLLLTSHAMGGFIHLLLVAVAVVLLVRVIQGHRDPPGTLKTMTVDEVKLNVQAKEDP